MGKCIRHRCLKGQVIPAHQVDIQQGILGYVSHPPTVFRARMDKAWCTKCTVVEDTRVVKDILLSVTVVALIQFS